ncbi:hypothetical protein [Cupriavidus pauculus]|uniref:hypothetical protein n=1 Tax=Cupriavidus pauculus TaxID=82633 RepID=UPI00215543E4|nr:hypothetical protein [Cupriavidus pauculus]
MKARFAATLATRLATLFAALGITACATDPAVEPPQTLVGEIQIRGNDPFPTIMLETDELDFWELRGMTIPQARTLAGKRVSARGKILVAPGPDVWLPAFRVDKVPEPVSP